MIQHIVCYPFAFVFGFLTTTYLNSLNTFLKLRDEWRSLKPIWSAINPRRRKQMLALQFLGFFAALSEVVNIGTLMPFLRLLASPAKGLSSLGPLAKPLQGVPDQYLLLALGLAFMTAVVASVSLRVFTIRSQIRLSAFITADLGEQIFSAVLRKPYSWHLQTNSSKVLSFLTREIYSAFACVQALMLFGINLLVVLLLGSTLISLAPALMLAVTSLMAIFYYTVFYFTRSGLRTDGETQVVENQKMMQVVQESLGGIRDVILDHNHSYFSQAFLLSNTKEKLAAASINIKAQVPRYLIEGFTMILLVGLCILLALDGKGVEQQLPLLGALSLGAYRLLQPLQQCFGAVSGFQANKVALHRLAPLLELSLGDHLVDANFAVRPIHRYSDSSIVHFCDVSFRYRKDGPLVLKDLNLAITVGERLAFVGTTGSGKSTTGDLILGLLKPSNGKILINGNDLHSDLRILKSWQSSIAHVPQHIYLSDASFISNIAFGISPERINVERVYEAARQARIAELIEGSSEGYDTLVGERGVRLSGGQRQRIGLARALYKNAKLLLLDEATSALDNHTETEVMAAIEGLNRDITVILIAHRLSTVKRCDRVVVMEHGSISACDSYQNLQRTHRYFLEYSDQL